MILDNAISALVSTVFPTVIKNVSPELRAQLASGLESLERAAKQTKSPWDDLLVALVRAVLVL